MGYDADAPPTNVPDRRLARRILIVGGVAGGASCVARLRRLDESVEIVIFDRGPCVAFANCGLPYYVGDVIADELHLLPAPYRAIVFLREMEGLSTREVAKVMGMTEDNVKTRLHRARIQLQKDLGSSAR